MICVIGAGRLELYVHCACALYSRVSFFNTMRKGLSQGDTCVCVLVRAYERVCVDVPVCVRKRVCLGFV